MPTTPRTPCPLPVWSPVRLRSFSWLIVIVAFGSVGCAESTSAPRSPEPPSAASAAAARAHASQMSVVTELGQIDVAGTEATFARLQRRLARCHREALARVELLAGDVELFVRVGTDGRARYAYPEASSLGDRGAEACMVQVLLDATWPKPQGGEGEVRKTLGFDPADDVRPPAAWRPDRVAAAVGAAADALERCKAGERGPYLVTAYIAPDGAAGRVITAGISSPSRGAQGRAQCILDVVRELKMPSPGSYVAKVSFAP